MPRTMEVVPELTPTEVANLTAWLEKHLPAAMREARGVSVRQAVKGMDPYPEYGYPKIEPIGVDEKTVKSTLKPDGTKRRGDQVEKMVLWTRKYLGSGPEDCPAGCKVCTPPPRDRPAKPGR